MKFLCTDIIIFALNGVGISNTVACQYYYHYYCYLKIIWDIKHDSEVE